MVDPVSALLLAGVNYAVSNYRATIERTRSVIELDGGLVEITSTWTARSRSRRGSSRVRPQTLF